LSRTEAAVPYPVRSLAKGLELLLLFKSPDHPVRITQASQTLGISPSTTHRLLAMLRSLGFARQDPKTHVYYAGPALLDLAQSLLEEGALCRAAQQELETLAARTRETVVLAVLRGSEAHFIASVESPEALRVAPLPPRFGVPAYATAAGKALLSELSRTQLLRLYSKPKLLLRTVHTIGKRSALERELIEVRNCGYATSFGETNLNVNSVSVLIRGARGRVYGSLGLLCPSQRLPRERVVGVLDVLAGSASVIARRLEASLFTEID
jgi:IclR family acetate operon transcriptional repressor